MGQIIDNKPRGGLMVDDKPSNIGINKSISNKLITRSVDAGSPYGLLLIWTYPVTETFTTEYNP